ncbi:catalase 1 [Cryomyces antarcticus]|nr:catalase 1 [Cryomyces antarcticus]
MTQAISSGLEKAQKALNGGSSGSGKKIDQLASVTKDVHDDSHRITSDFGTKQTNTDDWLRVVTEDKIGPSLLEDAFGRSITNAFQNVWSMLEVLELSSAFGTFRLHESAEDVTSAGILTDTSRETPLFTRFSTVLGSRGSADTVRDVRGFAVKFYTEEVS